MAKLMSSEREFEMRQMLSELREMFPYTESGFLDMANYVVNKLIRGNPDLTRVQLDICRYLFNNGTTTSVVMKKVKPKIKKKHKGTKKAKKIQKAYKNKREPVTIYHTTKVGKRLRMIQAARGVGKTTLAAIYAVFRIIHDPKTRVLIFSAGGGLASEISNWIIQIIEGIPLFAFMSPDEQNGDRSSVKSYDVHWLFRGSEKSPSIKCLGVNSNAQGSRADLVLADDIESLKNSRTVPMRELLVEQSKEFESICSTGDIVYLGTPQFAESIYNDLPSRGYDVRIWTGRYPNKVQMENYGEMLAPMLARDAANDHSLMTGGGLTGLEGQPTNPLMLNEELLQEKYKSQGASKYQLQFMLNTRLSDSDRFPLKINNLIFADFNAAKAPSGLVWCNDPRARFHDKLFSSQATDKMYGPLAGEYELREFDKKVMYIDVAGGGKNGDETAYAIVGTIASDVYVIDWGAVPGGFEKERMLKVIDAAKRNGVKDVRIEKNFGNGAYRAMIEPLFQTRWPVSITDDWVASQKELRIIDNLEPLLTAHRLIMRKELVVRDIVSCGKYGTNDQKTYSGFFQLSMITRDKGCLKHDDRLDALAGAVAAVVENVNFDGVVELEKQRKQEVNDWFKRMNRPDAFHEDYSYGDAGLNSRTNLLDKYAA